MFDPQKLSFLLAVLTIELIAVLVAGLFMASTFCWITPNTLVFIVTLAHLVLLYQMGPRIQTRYASSLTGPS